MVRRRDPKRTIPRATYLSVLLIAGFYTFSLWCLVIRAGAHGLVGYLRALADPTRFLFALTDRYVERWLAAIVSVLFVTSVFAALLAFHNAASRYFYALAREGLLPQRLGYTHVRHASSHVGSTAQTAIGTVLVALFAASGADSVLTLFSWLTNVGTLGVIALMALASLAVPAFFARSGGPLFSTRIAPLVAAAALLVVLVMAIAHFDVLTGSSGVLSILLPATVPTAAVLCGLRAWLLRRTNSARYRGVGLRRVSGTELS